MSTDSTPDPARAWHVPLAWVSLALVVALLSLRLSSYGIWDPWEIEVADAARRLADDDPLGSVALPGSAWLVSRGFGALGVDEWTGRLPVALSGVALLGLCFALVTVLSDRRTALYATLIAGSSAFVVLNARTMLGEAPVLALQLAIVAAGSAAVLGRPAARTRVALALACLGCVVLAILFRGALLGALAPLAALCVLAATEGKLDARGEDRVGFGIAVVLWGLLCGLLLAVGERVLLDSPTYDVFRGGASTGGQPPTFDAVIERAFHAFAPWSGLLPLALARLLRTDEDEATRRSEGRLRVLVLTWLGAAYAALTLYLSRYGPHAAVIPVAALAIPVALLLRDLERQTRAAWGLALCAALGVGLLLRDFALYPEAPMHGMAVATFGVPDVFNPKRAWVIALGVFGALSVLALGTPGEGPLDLRAPYRLLAAQLRRGFGTKLWVIVLALALLGLLVFGALSWTIPRKVGLSTLGARTGKVLGFLPLALPLAIAGVQLALHYYGKLGRERALPVLAAGLLVGAYTGHGFMPALSAHFSPREVYETYNALARSDEALIEYRVGSRTAAYYAKGESLEVETSAALIDQLADAKRRWAVLPADELAAVDRSFRARTQRHLFVADARSAKVVLATNQPIPGRKDENFLTTHVLREPPRIGHPIKAVFDRKIELLGYDLKLPHEDHVGAGESFELTWYWKALAAVPGSYKVFLHVDHGSSRIHGDHDPVDGKYPVRLWNAGDVIVDRQKLDVPASHPDGDYTLYVGFYSGETRMEVVEGPEDDVNRVPAGVLRIR